LREDMTVKCAPPRDRRKKARESGEYVRSQEGGGADVKRTAGCGQWLIILGALSAALIAVIYPKHLSYRSSITSTRCLIVAFEVARPNDIRNGLQC
jgi:hypothetical protein